MDRRLFALLVLVLLIPAVHSSMIKSLDVYVSPSDRRSSLTYNITFYESQPTVSIVTYYNVYGVRAEAGGRNVQCSLSENAVGSSIICNGVNSKNIVITFHSNNLVTPNNGVYLFRFGIPITDLINQTYVKVDLPKGYIISGRVNDSYYPPSGVIGSSGRTIYVSWNMTRPQIGEYLRFYVYYEPASKTNFIYIIAAFLALAILVVVIYISRSRSKMILTALSSDEKRVMEMILKNKNIYQRDIVRETGFSKAKVSRILKTFEERGLIKRERRGRKSKIKLVNFWVRR